MPLGRIDEVTSANVGLIRGGTARNVVPERCTLEAEVRSHDDARVTRGRAADRRRGRVRSERLGVHARDAGRAEVPRLPVPRRRPRRAARGRRARPRRATTARLGLSGGAADANVFNARGLQCVNLANGMTDIHTPDERIAVEDLERMVDVTLALVDAAREAR